jgi:hypothetical protein
MKVITNLCPENKQQKTYDVMGMIVMSYVHKTRVALAEDVCRSGKLEVNVAEARSASQQCV